MTALYLLCPGPVRSRTDGDWHHIGARQLAHLYRVPMDECVVLPPLAASCFLLSACGSLSAPTVAS